MAPRVNSELLLVGSLPADSADSALRAAAAFYDGLVFALPDGETGPRSAWVGYERERLVRPNPDVVVVQETESPTGIPRHAYETPVFGIRPGATGLHWDSWPRIDDAIAGYQVFRALRADGVIPAGLRFQIGLPFPSSALNAFKANFAHDYPIAERGFEDLVARELTRLTDAIAPERPRHPVGQRLRDPGHRGRPGLDVREGAWERFAGPVTRLTRLIPEATARGLPPVLRHVPRMADVRGPGHERARPHGQPRRRGVRPARRLAAPGRTALPAQRRRSGSSPRCATSTSERRARLPGHCAPPRRHPRAPATSRDGGKKFLDDFGVAMYCGFGRQPGRGRRSDDARARPRGPHRPRRHERPVALRARHRSPGQQLHRLAYHHVTGRLPLDPGDQLVHRRAAEFGQRHGHAGHRDLEEGQALVLVEAHHRHLTGHVHVGRAQRRHHAEQLVEAAHAARGGPRAPAQEM